MEKIKHFIDNVLLSEKGKDVMVVIIVILVGLGSFELGRLSKDTSNSKLKVIYPNGQELQQASTISIFNQENKNTINNTSAVDLNKNFFASKKGKKYYSLGCSAGKTIKQENRIYFENSDQAENAGYTLSTSCN